MTIGSLSSLYPQASSAYNGFAQQGTQQTRIDFQQLAQALQSGNLGGAQQAFSGLDQLLSASSSGQNNAQANQQGSRNNPLRTDLSAVGLALKSGDLVGAQKAFAQLQADIQAYSRTHSHAQGLAQSVVPGGNATAAGGDGDNDGSGMHFVA